MQSQNEIRKKRDTPRSREEEKEDRSDDFNKLFREKETLWSKDNVS